MTAVRRHTRIVATLGPISETRSCIEGLISAGLDAVRLSMSNASRPWHRHTAGLVREVAAEQGREVVLLADLQGRKNRLGEFPDGRATWAVGERVTLTARPGPLATHRTWTTYPWDPHRTPKGAAVLVDDGMIVLTVEESGDDELRCVVVDGGPVTNGRGVTLPGGTVYPPGLTQRDADDLGFALDLGVELVALSFADHADDYHAIRTLAPDPIIVGKVESLAAVQRLPDLAATFDGLMVARGDLSQQLAFESVPRVQREIIAACASRGRTSMVATQVLHSMRTQLRPTAAEVADVAQAVLTGADALVLTGETGYGRHPVHVVDVLRRIIEQTEREGPPAEPWPVPAPPPGATVAVDT